MNASKQQLPPSDRPVDATLLLGGLLGIIGGTWVSPSQFETLGQDLGLEDGPLMIEFLTGVRTILAALPDRMYETADARRAVMTAIQDALDAAIDREEALLEQEELAAGGTPGAGS